MTTTARVLGVQLTGGSTSTRDAWEPMRIAAASARNLLLTAAAIKWNVPATELTIEKSMITHTMSNKRAALGEFAQAAAMMPVPPIAIPKAQKDWKLLGTSPPRLDVVEKTRGTAQFGIDVRPEGLLYAAIKHIPFVSGTLHEVRWNGGAAPKEVLHQVRGENYLCLLYTSTRYLCLR